MGLAGFEHLFERAVEVHLPGEMIIRVAPPIVTALLKIIPRVDDPYRRAKDLQDIRILLRRYALVTGLLGRRRKDEGADTAGTRGPGAVFP